MSGTGNPGGSGTTAGLAVVGYGMAWVVLALVNPASSVPAWMLAAVGPLLLITILVRWWRDRHSTLATLGDWQQKTRQSGGVASARDHRRVSSARAMRKRAHLLRPSLAGQTFLERRRTPTTEFATKIARVGYHQVWSPVEDVTLRVGGPRAGKTGELGGHIIDAPGAVVVTSTRGDLIDCTAALRARRGEVHIFNPEGLGGYASTIKWSPLVGCKRFETADRRAGDMIPPSNSSEAEHWNTLARPVLALLMHAAALEDLPMRHVLEWVASPDERTADIVDNALDHGSDAPDARSLRATATQFFNTTSKTRSSIITTLMPALGWLSSAQAAGIGDVESKDTQFDVRRFITERGSLYLLGQGKGAVAPLIAALTSEIAYQARQMAERLPGQRLDPPLTIALDEAALVCPVPLDDWTADFGGRGVTLHISLQSLAQMRKTWGHDAAGIILNNSGTILVFGGTRDSDDLATWSQLSGEREVHSASHDADGKLTGTSARKEPVLSPADIAGLPKGVAMIIRRGMPVSIGKPKMMWDRRDVQKARKSGAYKPVMETTYRLDGDE